MGGQASADGSEPLFEVLSKFGKVRGDCVSGRLIPFARFLAKIAGFGK